MKKEKRFNYKSAIFIIVLTLFGLIMPYVANATLDTTKLVAYYSFDSDCQTDDHASFDGTNNGATNIAGGKLSNACDFESGDPDYIIIDALAGGHSWENGFSICNWFKHESNDAIMMWQLAQTGGASYVYNNLVAGSEVLQAFAFSGSSNAVSGSDYTNKFNWYFTCMVVDSDGHVTLYENASLTGTDSTPNLDFTNTDDEFNIASNTANANTWDGILDEFSVWSIALTTDNVTELYNGGDGLNPLSGGGPVNDTTPPVITDINQEPANLTVLNALEEGWIINATITDNVQLDNETIFINLTNVDIEVFIGGELTNAGATRINYSNSSGSLYEWYLDENNYLSGTHVIDHEFFEDYPLDNNSLDTANKWIRILFNNVSNDKQLVFSEIMDTNTTGIAEYYYCNDNYTTGNPISNEWCTKFYTQSGDDLFHDHTGDTYHRVMPIGIDTDTGRLNDVYVTSDSYILKRGSTEVEYYYYLNYDSDSVWTTNNNGNSWSGPDNNISVNAHIHQIGYNETIQYRVCASDNSSNQACSIQYNDTIDFPTLPPIAPIFIVPELYQDYNTSMIINHTESFSQTGQTINGYALSYKINTSSVWTELTSNNYPNTEYTWDISNLANGEYNIRLVVNDSLGLQTTVFSVPFFIENPESLQTQLLNNILAELQETNSYLLQIVGGSMLLALVILFLGIGAFAFIRRQYILLAFDGVVSLLISMLSFINIDTGLFYRAMTMIFLFLSFGLFFLGVILHILKIKEEKFDNFYY